MGVPSEMTTTSKLTKVTDKRKEKEEKEEKELAIMEKSTKIQLP